MEKIEDYLKQEDRKKGFQQLIGAKKLEAQILNELQRYQQASKSLISTIDKLIRQYFNQYGENQSFKQLTHKFLLKQLENESDSKIKEEAIKQLEKLFGINYHAQHVQKQGKRQEDNQFQIDAKQIGLERFIELIENEDGNFDDYSLYYMSLLKPDMLKQPKFLGWFLDKGYSIIPFLDDTFSIFEIILKQQNHSESLVKELQDKKFQQVSQMHTQQQIEKALKKYPELFKNTDLILILLSKRVKKQNYEDEELINCLNQIIE